MAAPPRRSEAAQRASVGFHTASLVMALTDEELMRRVQAGETVWFEEVVRRYRPVLTRVAASKLADLATAEDVVQETFLAAFACRQSFKPNLSLRVWLVAILFNACKRVWRQRQQPTGQPLPLDPALAGEPQEGNLLAAERDHLLRAALRQLPEPQADTLRLRFFVGLSFDEIAASMNCSVSGAKRRAKLGLESLAGLLRSYQEPTR